MRFRLRRTTAPRTTYSTLRACSALGVSHPRRETETKVSGSSLSWMSASHGPWLALHLRDFESPSDPRVARERVISGFCRMHDLCSQIRLTGMKNTAEWGTRERRQWCPNRDMEAIRALLCGYSRRADTYRLLVLVGGAVPCGLVIRSQSILMLPYYNDVSNISIMILLAGWIFIRKVPLGAFETLLVFVSCFL